MTSSGRDSNPRPSGPKPDALARLRYRSIFGIFQPIGRGLSITHLEAWWGGEYFTFACAAPARHSELMPVLRIFRRCFVGGMKNGRGTGGCIANHGLDIGYLPFAPLSLISCTTSRPGLMNRKRKTHVRVRLNNNRFYSCASSNPKLSRLGIFRAPARAPKRTGLLNACPQDLLLWRPSAFFWLSGESRRIFRRCHGMGFPRFSAEMPEVSGAKKTGPLGPGFFGNCPRAISRRVRPGPGWEPNPRDPRPPFPRRI